MAYAVWQVRVNNAVEKSGKNSVMYSMSSEGSISKIRDFGVLVSVLNQSSRKDLMSSLKSIVTKDGQNVVWIIEINEMIEEGSRVPYGNFAGDQGLVFEIHKI